MTAHAPTRPTGARPWALSGTALVAAGVLAVLGLHVVAVDVDPVRRTLSQYALGPWKPVFDAAVLAVAVGSLAVLAGLRSGRGSCACAAWRTDAAGVGSPPPRAGWAPWRWPGSPILLGFVLRSLTGVPWWQFVPLGLFERGLALTEVTTVVVMGLWAARAARHPS